jgi:TonB-dependent siderophore receptor
MRVFESVGFLASFVLLSSLSLPVAAQESPKQPPDSTAQEKSKEAVPKVEEKIEVTSRYVPEESTTATKYPVDPQLIPASISSVSSILLQEQNATTLHDAMSNVAGSTTNNDSGFIESFVLRGFDSTDSGLLLVNGAYEPRTGINQTYNIDRLEVVRGPIGFLYGGNAMAGAVNLVRKQPLAQDFSRIEFLAGSYQTGRTEVDVNHHSADSSALFRLNGMWQSSDGYRDRERLKAYAVNPSLTLRVSDRTAVNFDVEAQRTDGTLDMGIPIVNGEIPDVPRTRNYGSPFDTARQDTGRVQINLESVLSPTRTMHNKVYFTDQKWTDSGAVLAGVFPAPGDATVLRLFGDLLQKVRVAGDQFDTVMRFGSGPVRHELVAGIEAQELKVNSTVNIGLLPPIDLVNPVETAQTPIAFIPGAGFGVDLKIRTIAPYVLEVLHLQERWHLSLGGRIDSIDQKNGIIGVSKRETDFSPFVGVLYSPSSQVSLYGNYGEGFNPISLGVVNKDPKPEKSRGTEVGLKTQTLSGRLRASATLYKLKKNNIAIVDQTGLVAQLGDQESKGAELELSASLLPGMDMLLVYGYTDATLTRFTRIDPLTGAINDFSGNDPTWAPKNVFNSWIGKGFGNGIRVAGGVRYADKRFVDEANQVVAGAYTTLNMTLSLEKARWTTSIYLNNLTNRKYETRGFNSVIPAAGFNVNVGLRLRM